MRYQTIAVVGCRRTLDADPADLYPDPDFAPLRAALLALGLRSVMVSWDAPSVGWEQFARVVVSSTWDSVDRPAEYLCWAREVAGITALVNDVVFIEWNLDKRHQRELEAAGIPVIPTVWVEPGDQWVLPTSAEFVVKPSISAGGRATARYAAGDETARHHVQALHEVGQTVMIQDYIAEIDIHGEVDLVFFDGVFSHAVQKRPALKLGSGVVERPWERMAWDGEVNPDGRQRAVADGVLRVVQNRIGRYPVYARVDLINGPFGTPLVLEIELIDPYLSLDTNPAAAGRFARAILDTLPSP